MEKKSNKIKIVIIAAVILVLLSISVILLPNFFSDEKMLYGKYEFVNDAGEKSLIVIDKETVYLENINYEECENLAVIMYELEMNINDDTLNHDHDHDLDNEIEEREKIKEEFGIDYKSAYDMKKFSYDLERSIDLDGEEQDSYSLLVKEPDEQLYGISLYFDIKEKKCFVGNTMENAYCYKGK